jgi:Ribbon-helix-helix protein, copG family
VRTTLTLDDDVAARIRSEARKSGKSFQQVVNEALREAFIARAMKELPPFTVKARPLGLRPGLSYDCVSKLLEEAEGPDYR